MSVATKIGDFSDYGVPTASVLAVDKAEDVCTPEALDLVARLTRAHGHARELLLTQRSIRAATYLEGAKPGFSAATATIRNGTWRVAPAPQDLADRRCEITGPADRKMIVSALNSGARGFMADLEDSLSPTWPNITAGHRNLRDASDLSISFERPDGRIDVVHPDHATLLVRPRGLHLPETRVIADGRTVAASIFDVALLGLHVAGRREARGSGLYLYLPKIESHHEAQWWDALLADVERRCGLKPNSIRVSVLIETAPAAYEMEEILFALRDRITALNAGRWDYLFSMIKVIGLDRDHIFADRRHLTMSAPFMAAYASRLVEVCHRRGAHAIGGMAAFIPDRRDEVATKKAIELVGEDKEREVALGYDGTWVAHPDLVPIATSAFDAILGDRPNQLEYAPVTVGEPAELMNTIVPGAGATLEGANLNLAVALEYLVNWLDGRGAVAIHHLMEDLATAEISRVQIWQWLHSGTKLAADPDPPVVLDEIIIAEAIDVTATLLVTAGHRSSLVKRAGAILSASVLDPELPPFLSSLGLPALDEDTSEP